jgi:hypothetical protein
MLPLGSIARPHVLALISILASCAPATTIDPASSPAQRIDAHRAAHALLYAGVKHYVDVYRFPDGNRVGSFRIKGSISAMCSDDGGNVFIAAAPPRISTKPTGYVEEYAPGSKAPVAMLSMPKNEIPTACSSDPANGNLAVTVQNTHDYAPGVAIYAKANGTPSFYRLAALGADPQAAYDDSGNLFATSGGDVGAELPAGKSAFVTVTLGKTLGGVAHVQWDGAYWALQSFDVTKHNGEKLFERIYRVEITGSSGRVAHEVRFDGWPEKDPGDSWIQSGAIVATPRNSIVFWAYPNGGRPAKIVHSNIGVKAVTVSAGA